MDWRRILPTSWRSKISTLKKPLFLSLCTESDVTKLEIMMTLGQRKPPLKAIATLRKDYPNEAEIDMARRLFQNCLLTWCLMWCRHIQWNVPVIEWTNHRYFSPWYHFTVRDVTFSSLISCYCRDVCNIFYLHHFTAVAWCDIFFFDIFLLPWCNIFFLDIFSLPWWTRPFLLGGAFCIYCFYTTLSTTSCQVTRLFTGTLYFLFRDCLPRVWK